VWGSYGCLERDENESVQKYGDAERANRFEGKQGEGVASCCGDNTNEKYAVDEAAVYTARMSATRETAKKADR
jgi:hypothetical protein